jgi:GTP cyclohydrolase I/GTP cyclohydrolase-4
VRLALKGVDDAFPGLADGDFVLARQVNLETIHDHDVLAERWGTVGELRRELETGDPVGLQTTLEDWLGGRAAAG